MRDFEIGSEFSIGRVMRAKQTDKVKTVVAFIPINDQEASFVTLDAQKPDLNLRWEDER